MLEAGSQNHYITKPLYHYMNCREGNQQIIRQITNLLDTISNQIYTQPLDVFKGVSIGQHFRHILDFYLCLIKGMEQGTVDYAGRDRNPRAESDVYFIKQAFCDIAQMIDRFSEETPVKVWGDFSAQAEHRPVVVSSIGRELMFAYDHAVHHLAMIKIGIAAAAPHVHLDHNLGIAPSTIKHLAEMGH